VELALTMAEIDPTCCASNTTFDRSLSVLLSAEAIGMQLSRSPLGERRDVNLRRGLIMIDPAADELLLGLA